MKERTYIAVDLKSFYASVECQERGLHPLFSNLVVADETRSKNTICLAVTPALKAYGVGGRARMFEVQEAVQKINAERRKKIHGQPFRGISADQRELEKDPYLELTYYVAMPRMSYYIEYSRQIYDIYLEYFAKEDIHVYSIDEVFVDITTYMHMYQMDAETLTRHVIQSIFSRTGITATGGIGTNLFLAKCAMDIVAKHKDADENGVRIAHLDEYTYRKELWGHLPMTDFWRFGGGTVRRLAKYGIETMGDLAIYSLEHEDDLYKEFGINAELIIDHAWGFESCTMQDIKSYRAQNHSLACGQVLMKPYSYEKGELIVKEMSDQLCLQMTEKHVVTDQIHLSIGYDVKSVSKASSVSQDWYGRNVPTGVHAGMHLPIHTNGMKLIRDSFVSLYEQIVNADYMIRRVNVTAEKIVDEEDAKQTKKVIQYDLFQEVEENEKLLEEVENDALEERKLQSAILQLKNKYGKNSVMKGMNLEEDAMTLERNGQIGGHKA